MATKKFTFEGVRLFQRNFAGREDRYNAAGKRNFCFIVPEEAVEDMLDAGFNVKRFKPDENDPEALQPAFLKVNVNFGGRSPASVYLMSSNGRTAINEDTASIIDAASLESCDIIITPYEWTVGDKSGCTPYLAKMYAVLEEDVLDRKYANTEEPF